MAEMNEFQKRYAIIGDIRHTLENLTSSMYVFRERIEKLYKSLCLVESENSPRLPANVDKVLRYKSFDCNRDSNYTDGLVNIVTDWPIHKFESLFTHKCSGLWTDLIKTYTNVLERKQRYGAKLFVMCHSYKRSINRISEHCEQLHYMATDNVKSVLVRWIEKELRSTRSEADKQCEKLKKYMDHKQSVSSKLVQRMQCLDDQLSHLEETQLEKVQKIMTETVTKYSHILKHGNPQQQKMASDSLLMKLRSMHRDGKLEKWLEAMIGQLHIPSDLKHELMALDDEEIIETTARDTSYDNGYGKGDNSNTVINAGTDAYVDVDTKVDSALPIDKDAPASIQAMNISDETDLVCDDHDLHNEPFSNTHISDVTKEIDATADCFETWIRFEDQLSLKDVTASSITWPEAQNERDGQPSPTDNDVIGFDDDFVPSSGATLAPLKVRVITTYEKRDKSQISLRPGMIIKQTESENAEGLCYGYKRNKFRRKIYGLYPAHCVEQVHAN